MHALDDLRDRLDKTIRISTTEESGHAVLEIADNGIGVPGGQRGKSVRSVLLHQKL